MGRAKKLMPNLKRLSGKSLFPNCKNPATGVRYLNSAVEPYAAVNPTNADNLIASWQVDRYSNGAASGLAVSVSFDRGENWKTSALPLSNCVKGGISLERATDPWISFGPDGTAYLSTLAVNKTNPDSAIVSIVSKDGGKTWKKPQIIKLDTSASILNDKESITADPLIVNQAYAVWTRFKFLGGGKFKNPTWFAKTTDGAKTWKSKIIFNPGPNNNTVGSIIVANPHTGRLHHFFILVINKGTEKRSFIMQQISNDGGDSWSKGSEVTNIFLPDTVAGGVGEDLVGAFNYLSVDVRTSITVTFSPTIDPVTGDLYLVWEDARFTSGEIAEVALTRSTDGGKTWRKPIRINQSTGKPAFLPTVAVNQSGKVGVTYYQFTSATPTNALPAQFFFKLSHDKGKSFPNQATKLTKPFNLLTAPFVSGGFFIGDYQNMFVIGETFYPVFTKVNDGRDRKRTSIFTTKITPS
ncbi:exo-alpha-sialidase [Hazenella sp. IB182357]|uniref:Exo-alpha-sialidase n=1 Tax=Polycladospora coralii TaxID=2771432 RepID=A0A926NC84_9BACL|nr:exo-alpha-sialidase [Polycladospora coralii]MBD1372725.1 exo-alpha-sialidase [Polycladospora coralii]MBS7531116.1 hypothetical protein [Polycladospora coralii]